MLSKRVAGKLIGRSLMYSFISTDWPLGNMMCRGVERGVVLSLYRPMTTGDMTLTWLPSSNSTGSLSPLYRAVEVCSCLLCLQSGGVLSGGVLGASFGGSFTIVCVFVPAMLFCREVMGTS